MTEPPNTPPVQGAVQHDRRGALALAILGLVGLGGSSFYSFTSMEYPDMWLVTMIMGFSFALLLAAALRGRQGRVLAEGNSLVALHREVGARFHHNLLRFLGLAMDVVICVVPAMVVMAILDDLPRTGSRFGWASDGGYGWLKGMELWRVALRMSGTSAAADILGPMLVTGLCSMLIFVPAAWLGATPGMLICGFRWLRAEDGQRVGALHAILRFLAMPVFAAPQAVLTLLGTVFGTQRMKVVRTGQRFTDKSLRRATLKARRTIADLVCRTETMRPATYNKPD
jgi:hypothetical protein